MTINKLISTILCLILLLTVSIITPAYSETVKLGWTTEQAQVWARMKNENHPLYQKLKSAADTDLSQLNTPDKRAQKLKYGLFNGLYYLVLGDINYAYDAYATISQWKGKDGIGTDLPHRNTTRHNFGTLVMFYSWIADVLPPDDQAHFKSILELWADLVLSDAHGTRPNDSDESTGHYLGLVMFALAIQDEDPTLSSALLNFIPAEETTKSRPVGGLTVTGSNRDTMRNTIADYVKLAKGGEWLESTEYNANTLRYLIQYSRIINQALGNDKFPEVTDFIPSVIETQIQMLTPDLEDLMQWGDIQHVHNTHIHHRIALTAVLAHFSQDPRMNTLFDKYLDGLVGTGNPHYFLYVNPYATRAPISGQTHNASGRGLAFHHSGWQQSDSFFSSAHFGRTYVDHELENQTNFGLFRNREWVIDFPRAYEKYPKGSNTLLVSGGLFSSAEARGQTAYETGAGYTYHVGTTGGQVGTVGDSDGSYYNPPPETLHEWTRSYLYIHHADTSDSVVIFDRVNNSNPITSPRFERLHDIHVPGNSQSPQLQVLHHNAETQWVLHLPNDNIAEVGNKISWQTEGGQDVSLTSFFSSDYATQIIDERAEGGAFIAATFHESELKHQLRLIPSQKSGHQSMLNVVHAGSDANIVQHLSDTGARAEGILIESGNESVLAIFNGDPGIHPFEVNGTAIAIEPTPVKANGRGGHDPQRQSKNAQLRYFQTGFNLSFSSANNNTDIFLMDLDPQIEWVLTVDDIEQNLEPSSSGTLLFNIPISGEHTINIREATDADQDGDGIIDSEDNCTEVSNPEQRDTDEDGFGNVCDADLNNDGNVSFADLHLFRTRFDSTDPDADFDDSGRVSFGDLHIFRSLFDQAPGPAGEL